MMRRMTAALIAILMLGMTAFAALDVNVSFEKNYIDEGENVYNVFGTNDSDETKNIQIVSVTYEGETAKNIETSEVYTVAPNSKFDFSQSCTVPNGMDLSRASVRLFLWDNMGSIQPLTETYSPNGVRFAYTLNEAATTSAGVYDIDNRLVRTLWNAEERAAGTHYAVWDGKNDNGALMEDGDYHIIVMSNNVNYELYTLVGNTSDRSGKRSQVMSEYRPISDMSVYGNRMYYSNQYMENSRTLPYFNLDACHTMAGYFERRKNRITIRNCTDGQNVYYLSYEYVPEKFIDNDAEDYAGTSFSNYRMFVSAINPVSNSEVVFDCGKAINNFWGSEVGYRSAIGILYKYQSEKQTTYGDIAVQKYGDHLIVVYGYDNSVRTINKQSGAIEVDNAISEPNSLAVDNDDNVWISYKDESGNPTLGLFGIDESGNLSLIKSAPESVCLDDIIAIAVSPDGKNITLTYGGSTSKVASYNISTWAQNWILGTGESYVDDPNVYDDKFMFYNGTASSAIKYSFLTYENNNTLWLGDPGNERCIKYDLTTGQPVLIDRICHPTVSYNCSVDTGNPTRIFHGSKEYELIYDTDDPDSAWSLKRNWGNQTSVLTSNTNSFIDGVLTLSSGRTFCAATSFRNGKYFIYEITDKEIINTGIDISGYTVLNDGKMTLQKAASATVNGVSGRGLYQRKMTGTDENGYPTWAEDELIAFVPNSNADFTLTSKSAVTDGGIVAEVKTANSHSSTDLRDMRMGAYPLSTDGTADWIWKACPATSAHYTGDFPADGALEINAWYTWHNVYAYGRNLVAQYRGEGYRQQQANKFYHMYDNGLLVNMFGEAWNQRAEYGNYGEEFVNGNGFTWVWVKSQTDPEDVAYTIQGGEAGLSGALVYKISGLTTIHEQEIPILWKSGQRNGLNVSYYGAGGETYSELISSGIEKAIDLGAMPEGSEKVCIEGYIEAPEDSGSDFRIRYVTDGNVEIYINNNLQSETATTRTITAERGEKVKIKIAVTPVDGVYSGFELYYLDGDGKAKLFPTDKMWTEPVVYEGQKTVRNLLEGLPYDKTITDKKAYGWDFTNWLSYANSVVSTNVRSYDSSGNYDLNLYANIGKTTSMTDSPYATRALGEVREDMSSWEISAEVAFAGQLNGYFSSSHSAFNGPRGRYIDVLDVNDKVIARVYPGDDFALYGNDEKVFQAAVSKYPLLSFDIINELSDNSELKIYASNGNITIAYRDSSITTTVYDPEAQWDKPATLKVTSFENCYYSPHGEAYQTDFASLKYTQYASDQTCRVTFYAEDKETVLKVDTVQRGNGAMAPSVERDGYILTWSGNFSCVTEDMEVYAIYTPVDLKHSVTFVDDNGLVLTTLSGVYGETVNYTAPQKDGYKFIGWYTEPTGGELADLTNRLTDITVYARYTEYAKASYDFETVESDLNTAAGATVVNPSTGAVTAGTYSGVNGSSGFTNIEYYLTYGTNLFVKTVDDTTALYIRPSSKNAGDYVRFTFTPIKSDEHVKVSYRVKPYNYYDTDSVSKNNGGFGEIYGTSNGTKVEVLKATCSSKDSRGIAVWNKDSSSWITLVASTDKDWHDIEYRIDVPNQRVDVYVDNALKATVPFVNGADTIDTLEFNMLNASTEGKSSMYYIDDVSAVGY